MATKAYSDNSNVEDLWSELKRCMWPRFSSKLTKLHQFCQNEWDKIPSKLLWIIGFRSYRVNQIHKSNFRIWRKLNILCLKLILFFSLFWYLENWTLFWNTLATLIDGRKKKGKRWHMPFFFTVHQNFWFQLSITGLNVSRPSQTLSSQETARIPGYRQGQHTGALVAVEALVTSANSGVRQVSLDAQQDR